MKTIPLDPDKHREYVCKSCIDTALSYSLYFINGQTKVYCPDETIRGFALWLLKDIARKHKISNHIKNYLELALKSFPLENKVKHKGVEVLNYLIEKGLIV